MKGDIILQNTLTKVLSLTGHFIATVVVKLEPFVYCLLPVLLEQFSHHCLQLAVMSL